MRIKITFTDGTTEEHYCQGYYLRDSILRLEVHGNVAFNWGGIRKMEEMS